MTLSLNSLRRALLAVCCVTLLGATMYAEDKNVTKSPDGTMEAFTRDGDLWVRSVANGSETRLTSDGSDLILNGYASWVYYEEILGRASRYKAFWWSPDSKKIGFYRFDNSEVPMFPIYSPVGQYGSINETRYPKAGDKNPEVKVGIVAVPAIISPSSRSEVIWADFEMGDQYFGIPFWGADSRNFFVAREPRRQNQLGLYSINAVTGKKTLIYTEHYPTWLDWIEGMHFGEKGLYMVRNFESGWQQIYYLTYDGKTQKCLTDDHNWDMSILRVDEKKGDIWYVAKCDNRLHPTLYRIDKRGKVYTLTDPAMYASNITFAPDGKSFTAVMSTISTPSKLMSFDAYGSYKYGRVLNDDSFGKDFSDRPKTEIVKIDNEGFDLYGIISYPRGFNEKLGTYPVLMYVYGGPDTPVVSDRWKPRASEIEQWCYENNVIYMAVDPRSSGENGRWGTDQAFRQLTVAELSDYVQWAKYMQSKPYVRKDRIGVNGFSFGGTTTAMLVLRYPEYFSCGIAGGGVYDWSLYDSHYTERFMETPEDNAEGYKKASVLSYIPEGVSPNYKPGSLRLTHGTGDDNVHFQNTLQLVDALQKAGVQFELMIYPDGMHGYRGEQHAHDVEAEKDFWTRKLLAE